MYVNIKQDYLYRGVTIFGENATESTKILLQRATATYDQTKIDINGAWLNVDRRYNDTEFLEYTTSINLNVFFTKKQDADIPWESQIPYLDCTGSKKFMFAG